MRCPDLWRRGLASLLPLPPPPASDRLHPLCLLHTALFIELGPPRFVWLGLGLGGVRISLHSTRWRPRFIWLGLGLGLGLASLRDARPLTVERYYRVLATACCLSFYPRSHLHPNQPLGCYAPGRHSLAPAPPSPSPQPAPSAPSVELLPGPKASVSQLRSCSVSQLRSLVSTGRAPGTRKPQ